MKATPDQVEYLKSRVKRQEEEIKKLRSGMVEMQIGLGIVLKQVALEYGGEDRTIILRKRDDVNDWKERMERNSETGELKIKLEKA